MFKLQFDRGINFSLQQSIFSLSSLLIEKTANISYVSAANRVLNRRRHPAIDRRLLWDL